MNIYEKYAQLRRKIEALEEEKRALELEIMDDLDGEGLRDRTTPYGFFASLGRKSWVYSPAVAELTDAVKKRKKVEELEGIATIKKVTSYITYKAPQPEEEEEK